MPVGSLCIFALTVAVLGKSLTIQEALSGFGNPVIWLIVLAFFIARSFVKTGLGNRIAYAFIYLTGKKSLTLSYGLAAGDLLLAPAIPSNTARAGGIFFPIVKSLAEVFDSTPEKGTQKKLGSFLLQSSFHCNHVTSAMFITSMAANPLAVHIAGLQGVSISWLKWAAVAMVPGVCTLLLVPAILFRLSPPELTSTPDAKQMAKDELARMGSLKYDEKCLLGVFLFLLVGWIFPEALGGASATTVALGGLSILLLTNVLNWEDIKSEKSAWDTLVWFSVLITLATFLDKTGFIKIMGAIVSDASSGLSPLMSGGLLISAYFFIHYFFASSTAHVSALYGTFLTLGISAGLPPLAFALLLGFTSNLYSGLTHYSVGHAPIFFGAQYVDIGTWWRNGLIICGLNLIIWSAWIIFGSYLSLF